MNRAQKRAASRAANLTPKMSRLMAMQHDFAEIEKFFRALKRDELTEVKDDSGKWIVSQTNLEGTIYDALGSIEQWCDFFAELARTYLTSYNDAAFRQLISKLRQEQPVSLALIQQAENLLQLQRWLFLRVPSSEFNAAFLKIYSQDNVVA